MGVGHCRGDQNGRSVRGHANGIKKNAGRERTDFQQRVEFVSEFEGQWPWAVPHQQLELRHAGHR